VSYFVLRLSMYLSLTGDRTAGGFENPGIVGPALKSAVAGWHWAIDGRSLASFAPLRLSHYCD
jgi:hypothetical protein